MFLMPGREILFASGRRPLSRQPLSRKISQHPIRLRSILSIVLNSKSTHQAALDTRSEVRPTTRPKPQPATLRLPWLVMIWLELPYPQILQTTNKAITSRRGIRCWNVHPLTIPREIGDRHRLIQDMDQWYAEIIKERITACRLVPNAALL
jgi:hypothetical protein